MANRTGRLILLPALLIALFPGCASDDAPPQSSTAASGGPARDPLTPLAEHHAHIQSAEGGALLLEVAAAVGQDMGEGAGDARGADALIQAMDSAGVEKAQVLSVGYFFGFRDVPVERGEERLRAENDWVAEQVAQYPGRLYGACSLNPLDDYAPDEVLRCGTDTRISGLKLHFANSDVDLRDPDHVARVARVFASAAEARLPIVAHIRTRNPDYGAEDVAVFIADVLSHAPALPVQIAHMAGWGGYDPATDAALVAFIEAFESGALDRSLYTFDLAAVAFPPDRFLPDSSRVTAVQESNGLLTERIRALGTDRVLFATDWNVAPIGGYATSLQETLSLTEGELAEVMGNVGPMIVRADGRR